MCTTYEVKPRKNEDVAKIIMVKRIHRDATTFNWTTFNCWFKTSSDKLQNVSQSVNVSSLETVCPAAVRQTSTRQLFTANVDWFSKIFYQVICKNILYVYITKVSTSPTICCYATLWNSKIQKCYRFWQHPQQTVDVFVQTIWALFKVLTVQLDRLSQDCWHWLTD